MNMRPCVKVTVSNSKNVIERTHACTLYRRSSQGYGFKSTCAFFLCLSWCTTIYIRSVETFSESIRRVYFKSSTKRCMQSDWKRNTGYANLLSGRIQCLSKFKYRCERSMFTDIHSTNKIKYIMHSNPCMFYTREKH